MTAREVMLHPAFKGKFKAGDRCYCIRISDRDFPFPRISDIHGHTWKEAFRKAAIAITTNRLFGATR